MATFPSVCFGWSHPYTFQDKILFSISYSSFCSIFSSTVELENEGEGEAQNAEPGTRTLEPSHIVNTALNLTLPLIIWSYASSTFASGYFSIIGRTPVRALNRSVSSESFAVPEGHPWIDRLGPINS